VITVIVAQFGRVQAHFMRAKWPRFALLVFVVAAFALPGCERQQVVLASSAEDAPASGADMYAAYCASCHGKTGKGDGPAASALKVAPPDLTILARRAGGRYPDGQVFQIIKWGGAIASHGSREMPVWGVAFRPLSHENQKQVTARIEALTRYIGSLQQK
jgi:mono/diheme cytochrome c family protein